MPPLLGLLTPLDRVWLSPKMTLCSHFLPLPSFLKTSLSAHTCGDVNVFGRKTPMF